MNGDDLFWEAARINNNVDRFMWIDNDEIHVDLPVYAKARGIDLDEAAKEIEEIILSLKPDIKITTVP